MAPAAEESGPPGWRRYARVRARALAAGAVLAGAATCAARPMPKQSDEAVASLLGEAIGGRVDPGDYVWEPSRGFWSDAFIGRRVLFLGRRGAAGAPRGLYRAAVTLTRSGRPMEARATASLSRTDLADDTGLVVEGERAALATVAFDRTQSVEWLDLSGSRAASRDLRARLRAKLWGDVGAPALARRVSFARPPERVRYEFQSGDLVLAFDTGAAVLDPSGALSVGEADETGAFAGPEAELVPTCRYQGPWAWIRSHVQRPPIQAEAAHAAALEIAPAPNSIDTSFPPPGGFAPAEGRVGVYRLEKTTGEARVILTAYDMRVLAPKLVVGAESPATRTGHVSSGVAPMGGGGAIVDGIAIPSAPGVGAWDHGIVVAPLDPGHFTLFEAGGLLTVGAGSAIASPRGAAVQWPDAGDDARRSRALVCATAAGHVVRAESEAATPGELRDAVRDLQCVATSPAAPASAASALPVEGGVSKTGALLFVEAMLGPPVEPPSGGAWAIAKSIAPEPASIPAAYESSIDRLGSTVHVWLFMPHRFQWVIRAGEQEKSHRFGGQFETELTADDKARALFAVGLGIGKRRSPNGLRIAGSTGHAFHTDLGQLEATSEGLRLGLSSGAEPEGDATELPLTVEGRAMTTEARVRGPKQPRADLCVLPDGSVVLAEAEFDNHEGTASVLADLGCPLAVALDRGADRPAWTEDRATPGLTAAHPTSAVYALGRPLTGTVATAQP